MFKKWTHTTAIVESIVPQKRIALLAHDRRMNELVDWVERNFETLARHTLVCTRSTGRLVEEALYRSFRVSAGRWCYLQEFSFCAPAPSAATASSPS